MARVQAQFVPELDATDADSHVSTLLPAHLLPPDQQLL